MFESLPCGFFFLCKVVKLPIYLCCDRIKYVLACSVNYYTTLYSLRYALPTTLHFTLTMLHFALTMLCFTPTLRFALTTLCFALTTLCFTHYTTLYPLCYALLSLCYALLSLRYALPTMLCLCVCVWG